MAEQQNYQNHTRWFPLVHFVISPLLLVNLIWAIVCVVQEFDWFRVQYLLLSFTLVLMSVAARLQALKAQDRVIRLEERLRYRELLPPELAAKASNFRTSQIIALRFASDDELADLATRIANGELSTPKEIKMAVTNWRGDYLRV
ncbi:MAG: hypothetical protein KF881_07030 [Acidobacteria bacterium]|nr:hypothetical protein [Acidobacteriota bacterium]